MPMSASLDTAASSALGLIARVAAFVVIAVVGALAFVFAAAAALATAFMILGAALALRFAPKPARVRRAPNVLDATRTPTGWVVEGSARRRF